MHSIYNIDTGEIRGVLVCPDSLLQNHSNDAPEGCGVIPNTGALSGHTHFYDLTNDIVKLRPEITAEPNKFTLSADNVDSIVIQDLPLPCTIKVNETAYEVNDGEFEFTTDTVGTYTVTVEQFPYVVKSWEIEAV